VTEVEIENQSPKENGQVNHGFKPISKGKRETGIETRPISKGERAEEPRIEADLQSRTGGKDPPSLSVFRANGRRGLMIMQLIDCADEDLLEGKVIQGGS
jgi:hypothetical protein